MISLTRRRANENSTAGEIPAEEAPESSVATEESAGREGRLAVHSPPYAENSMSLVQVGGGYRWDRPPEDDCCPICHDDFHIPCRTNCGHWFCGSCVLSVWRFMAKFQQCVCPICGCLIFNLVSYPSALDQPGEDATGILSEISRYNRQHMVGWFGILKKAVAPPRFTWMRLNLMLRILRLMIELVRLDLVYHRVYGRSLFPYGSIGLLWIFCACIFVLLTYAIWKRWKRLRRLRQMAEGNVIG